MKIVKGMVGPSKIDKKNADKFLRNLSGLMPRPLLGFSVPEILNRVEVEHFFPALSVLVDSPNVGYWRQNGVVQMGRFAGRISS